MIINKFLQPSNQATGLFQLTLPIAIYFGIQSSAGWAWWMAAVFFWGFVYTVIGNNVGLHRFFSHGHFTVSKPVEYLLLWLGCMVGVGGPVSYAMTHVVHHKYPDTEFDPHGPIRGRRSWLMSYQKTVDPDETPVFSRRVIVLNAKYEWTHKYYIPFVLSSAGILWLIDAKVFLFLWAIPASAACWGIGWAVWRQHIGLTPQNHPNHRYEPVYEGLHLNHHLWPMAPDTAVNPKEIDWTYQASRLLRPTYNWQGQPNRNDQETNRTQPN